MVLNRSALIFLVIGAPVLLAAFFLSGQSTWTLIGFGITGLFTLFAFLRIMIGQGCVVPPLAFTAYALMWVTMLLATLGAQIMQPYENLGEEFKPLAWIFAWSTAGILLPQFVLDARDFEFFGRCLRWLGIAVSLSVFAAKAGIGQGEVIENATGEVRAFGPFGDQVGYVIAFFAVYAAARKSWVGMLLHVAALMITGTRAALLVLLFALAALYWVRSDGGVSLRGIVAWAARIAAIVVLVGLVLLSPAGSFIIERLTNVELLAITIAERFGSISIGLDIFLENPWIGVGYNGYNAVAWLHDPMTYFTRADTKYVSYASNQLVQTATDAGILGIAALTFHILTALRLEWRVARDHRANALLVAGFAWAIAFVVGNQTSCWLVPNSLPAFLWFLILGCAAAAWRLFGAADRAPVLDG